MPLPRKLIARAQYLIGFWFILISVLLPAVAFAAGDEQALHTSGDKSFWDRKNNRVELSGHAVVRQEGETLSADWMQLDFSTRTLEAKGHCIYVTLDSIIYGEEMHLNLDTRTGVVEGARVSNDRFTLAGERINKLAASRFQVHWGEYSTCKDCPNSWSLEAEDLDLTFEGYAFMSNVTTRIKDAPTVWLPYLILPIKTIRQTGILFPTYHYGTADGFAFVLPFFWAINRSSDMTFGLGDYTNRGTRAEWEGRYAVSSRSGGTASFDYTSDRTFPFKQHRWGLNAQQTQELPFGIDEKLKFIEMSDNRYPIDFGNDVNRADNLDIPSSLIFNYGTPNVSAYLAFDRFRNIINGDPDLGKSLTNFDPTTVQLYPALVATTNDKFIWGTPIAAGFTFGVANFTRSAGTFDFDPSHTIVPGQTPVFQKGLDPIREATRVALTPTLYTTLRPFDIFELTPSLTYYSYFYSFHNAQIDNLNRGYLLMQVDLSTQIEKIWDTPDPDRPKQKNLIRPLLTYSNIPAIRESETSHPFLQQIESAQRRGISGYNFDDYDIVPVNRSPSQIQYFTPLGNSLSYGISSQLITRLGAIDKPNPSYLTDVEFTVGQSLDFIELRKNATDRQPFSRLFSTLNYNSAKFTSSSTYYYTPYIATQRNFFVTSESFIFERAMHQRILSFDRSIGLTYAYDKRGCVPNDVSPCGTDNVDASINFSLSDYIMPTAFAEYSYVSMLFNRAGVGITFQSPAQCYRIAPSVSYSIQQHNLAVLFDFSLNITGSGFGGVASMGEFSNSGSAPVTPAAPAEVAAPTTPATL